MTIPLRCLSALACSVAALNPPTLHADLFWDSVPNGPVLDGGGGRWDLATLNWNNGITNVTWDAGGAIFGGLSSGLVVLDDSSGALQSSGLTFHPTADGSSYTLVSDPFDGIANDDTLVFSGAGGVVTANASAVLKNRLGGTVGLTKEGAGTLVLLNTANPFSGNVVVNAGVLAFLGQGTLNPAVFGAGTKTITVSNNAVLRPITLSNPNSAGGKNFVVGTGGATFDTPTGVSFTLDEGTQLSGAGNLTKTGDGVLVSGSISPTGFNFGTFTGAITINGGILHAIGDSGFVNRTALGSASAGTTINLGGSLRLYGATNEPLTISGSGFSAGSVTSTALYASFMTSGSIYGPVTLAGHALIGGGGRLSFEREISGDFGLTIAPGGDSTFTAANTFTGTTTVDAAGLTLERANGSIAGSSGVVLRNGAFLYLGNSGPNLANLNRVSDTAPILFKGRRSSFSLGSSSADTTETIGDVTVDHGFGVLQVTRGTDATVALTIGTASRTGQGVLTFAYATGGVLGGSAEKIIAGSAPLLVNGMTAPWMLDSTSNAFVTYDSARGFMAAPFSSTDLTTALPTDIVRENTSRTVTGTVTAWALRLGDGLSNPALTGGTVQLGSGGLILHPQADQTPETHTAQFYFGDGTVPVEAVIRHTASAANANSARVILAGTLTASALTYLGDGLTILAANNRPTLRSSPVLIHSGALHLAVAGAAGDGAVTVNGGTLQLQGNFLNASNALTFHGGVLELRSTSPTTFVSGSILVTESMAISLNPTSGAFDFTLPAATTFSRSASGLPITLTVNSGSDTNLQFTGPVSLEGDLIAAHNWRLRFLGGVSGPGRLVKTGTGFMNLGANNAGHSGDTEVLRGKLYFTGGNAFGTGRIILGDIVPTPFNAIPAPALLETNGGGIVVPNPILIRQGGETEVIISQEVERTASTTFSGPIVLERDLSIRQNDTSGDALVFTGGISGRGNLTITQSASGENPAGVVVLGGTNVFDGTTTIFQGEGRGGSTLLVRALVEGSLTGAEAQATGIVRAGIGTLLGGTGVIDRPTRINAGAILAPGGTAAAPTGAGTLEIGGPLTLDAASTFAIQLGGVLPGDGLGFYDQVNVTSLAFGTVSLNAAAILSLTLISGFVPSGGDFFILTRADDGVFSTSFAGAGEGTTLTFDGYTGTITYLADWTGDSLTSTEGGGNDVAILNVQSVPEPSSATLAFAGVASLGLRRFRRDRLEGV